MDRKIEIFWKMRKPMNKKAWLRIVEAFLAILIVVGAVLVIMSRQNINQNSNSEEIYEKQTQILEIVSNNDSLRAYILTEDTNNLNKQITKMVPASWNFTTNVCSIKDICNQNVPVDRDVYVKEILITSNLTQYSPKKLRFSVWMK